MPYPFELPTPVAVEEPIMALPLAPYAAVADLPFPTQTRGLRWETWGTESLTYDVLLRAKTDVSVEFVRREVSRASAYSLRTILREHPRRVPCQPDERLELYELTVAQLNDAARLRRVGFTSPHGDEDIWGMFVPRPDENGVNAILFTSPPSGYADQVLWHETAHHWYSVYCLELVGSETSEAFARRVQRALAEEER